jgi:hypothetical protein
MTGVGRETLLESAGTTFLKQNHKSRELRMLRLHLANMTIMQPVCKRELYASGCLFIAPE